MLRSWVPAFACGAGWSAKPLSGTREDEAGADEGGKRRSDSTYTFLRPLPKAPGPFEACSSSSNRLDLPQSQRCLWQPEGSRRVAAGGPPPSTRIWKGGAGEREIKAKDYLCFSCTGVRFFTHFDANVSFSMLHVSFLF